MGPHDITNVHPGYPRMIDGRKPSISQRKRGNFRGINKQIYIKGEDKSDYSFLPPPLLSLRFGQRRPEKKGERERERELQTKIDGSELGSR